MFLILIYLVLDSQDIHTQDSPETSGKSKMVHFFQKKNVCFEIKILILLSG